MNGPISSLLWSWRIPTRVLREGGQHWPARRFFTSVSVDRLSKTIASQFAEIWECSGAARFQDRGKVRKMVLLQLMRGVRCGDPPRRFCRNFLLHASCFHRRSEAYLREFAEKLSRFG